MSLSGACRPQAGGGPEAPPAQAPAWALAIHGGAGSLPDDLPAARREAYERSLAEALTLGQVILDEGGSALDAVEKVVTLLEDDPLFNAGRGAVFTADGRITFDASIMDGRDLSAGGVGFVEGVRHPITLARRVMQKTPHVLFVGRGAEAFAREQGLEFMPAEWFWTERRREQWERWKREHAGTGGKAAALAPPAAGFGTVGAVALDRAGHLAAATSTGGLTGKAWGRVGDSPIVGAGTYADDRFAAISCTGTGERFMVRAAAHEVVARMRHAGESLERAVHAVLDEELSPGDGGMIAVSSRGEIVLHFTTPSMLRGAADATGRFEVALR
ncbi:MAG: isoaspartyl peptidase/L-asparaginase [Acidobacteria bacterium]|nr:MAG: isoaspartyl peptidase/L-asparaginase [Acidobacteriota bacterium]